jgi:hypothetical protein
MRAVLGNHSKLLTYPSVAASFVSRSWCTWKNKSSRFAHGVRRVDRIAATQLVSQMVSTQRSDCDGTAKREFDLNRHYCGVPIIVPKKQLHFTAVGTTIRRPKCECE